MVNDPSIVCSAFNDHFVSVAAHIGLSDGISENDNIMDICDMYDHHESIQLIKQNAMCDQGSFSFSKVTYEETEKDWAE